jgi:hypothetical protein
MAAREGSDGRATVVAIAVAGLATGMFALVRARRRSQDRPAPVPAADGVAMPAAVFARGSAYLESWAGGRHRLVDVEVDGDRVTALAGRDRLAPGMRLLARGIDPAGRRTIVPVTVTSVQALSADADRVGLFLGAVEPDDGMRATGRTGLVAGAMLVAADGSPAVTATVVDLSPSGVGMVVDGGRTRPGDCRTLRIDWPWPLRATVEVRWTAAPDGRARMGGRFLDLTPGERSRIEQQLAAR